MKLTKKSSIWTKNIFTKLSEIWVRDQEPEIRDLEKTYPGSGARGKKSTESRLRINNTFRKNSLSYVTLAKVTAPLSGNEIKKEVYVYVTNSKSVTSCPLLEIYKDYFCRNVSEKRN